MSAPPKVVPGSVIHGIRRTYEVVDAVGNGSCGVCFRVADVVSGETFVLKLPHGYDDEETIRQADFQGLEAEAYRYATPASHC
jgi:hypothetical protein